LRYIQPFTLLSKLNILLLSNVLGMIWVEEYTSNKFYELFALDETIHQTSYVDIPEQNGIVERKHRHIVETACSLLLSAFVLNVF